MLLYKYLEYDHAISSISKARLKVSILDSLNDPYEMLPCMIDTNGKHLPSDQCRKVFLQRIAKKHGIICLSATATDPVLWAHYAARHTGIAFEFDFPMNGSLIHVDYKDKRVEIRIADVDANSQELQQAFELLLGRKFSSWSYEQEYRSIVPISEITLEDGLHFKAIPKEYFKRVILGCDCPVTEEAMRCLLDSSGFTSAQVARARLSDTDFRMIVQQAGGASFDPAAGSKSAHP